MATTSPSGGQRPKQSSSSSGNPVGADTSAPVIALAGNPNSGKTSLFNALTGAHRKVGNYPGVTVEKVEGRSTLPDGRSVRMIDLPGCYSLAADSEDEVIARNVVLGLLPTLPKPDAVIVVVSATALDRSLYLATQIIDSGARVILALNLLDVAARDGITVDAAVLATELGVPVVPINARNGVNLDGLLAEIPNAVRRERLCRLPEACETALAPLANALESVVGPDAKEGAALRLLTSPDGEDELLVQGGEPVRKALVEARDALTRAGVDSEALEPECRYRVCRAAAEAAHGPRETPPHTPGSSERADRVLTHWLTGPLIFLAVMGLIFQSIYAWSGPFMDLIEAGVGLISGTVSSLLGEGMLTDLLVDGVIAGVGNVIIFVPQIAILFLFLTILEDCGYLARGAFLVDRGLKGVGLSGKAFVPLMSSFACAIPGIMATRTMRDRRDRFVTILVAPLMSCSARLPVYALLIGAFVPSGFEGLTLLSMYVLSIVAALGAAFVLRKTMFKGASSPFVLELPAYTRPNLGQVVRTMGNRSWVFIKNAGTVILAMTIVLWFLAYFPKDDAITAEQEARIAAGEDEEVVENWALGAHAEQSYAGRMGKAIEPAIRPLGYDWRTGVGVIASFAAREVMVSAMGVIYSVGEADEESVALRDKLRNAKNPDGSPVFSLLSALSLMVFFVLACQCMSTLAVVKRETNSWRWPLFMFGYMTALAYVAALIVYQGGMALGYGP